jgi:hypothetical protein
MITRLLMMMMRQSASLQSELLPVPPSLFLTSRTDQPTDRSEEKDHAKQNCAGQMLRPGKNSICRQHLSQSLILLFGCMLRGKKRLFAMNAKEHL